MTANANCTYTERRLAELKEKFRMEDGFVWSYDGIEHDERTVLEKAYDDGRATDPKYVKVKESKASRATYQSFARCNGKMIFCGLDIKF